MKILYVDLETTGLNPLTCDILQIGLFVDDMDLDIGCGFQFEILVKRDSYKGEPYALGMHGELFKRVAAEGIAPLEVRENIAKWLRICGFKEGDLITVGGKNVAGFDIPFLQAFYPYAGAFAPFKISARVVDPGMLYFNPRTDRAVPSMSTCCERAGLSAHVAHTALADAMQCAALVRAYFKLL